MMEAVIDLESRSKCDLRTAGVTKYAKDESTSILCVGYKLDDEPKKLWIPERGPMPNGLWKAFKRGQLVAQNAGFEQAMIRYCLTRYNTLTDQQKAFLSELPASRWSCTAARSAAISYPRALENACQVAGLKTKKDMEGNRLMKKYMKPRKPSKHNPKLWWDDKDELRKIYKYCLTDIDAEYELHKALPELIAQEKEVWAMNEKINSRGILVDVDLVKTIMQMIAEYKIYVHEKVKELSGGTIESATQTAKVLVWINARTKHKLENLRAQTMRDAIESRMYNEDVVQMIQYRQVSSKASTAKYLAMLKAVDEDGRAKDLLMYSGAVPTARFTGQRLQVHNMVKRTISQEQVDHALKILVGV